jgi:hypothetical protein
MSAPPVGSGGDTQGDARQGTAPCLPVPWTTRFADDEERQDFSDRYVRWRQAWLCVPPWPDEVAEPPRAPAQRRGAARRAWAHLRASHLDGDVSTALLADIAEGLR